MPRAHSREPTRTSLTSASSNISNDNDASSSHAKTSHQYSTEFFVRIPKADLHIHLDGSIRISTLIDLAKQHNVELPSYDPTELQNTVFPSTYDSLNDYLRGFGYITACLRTANALQRVAFEVGIDAFHSGVRYLELRFAPQLHAIPGKLSVEEVICAVNHGLENAVHVADKLDKLAGDDRKFSTWNEYALDSEVVDVLQEVQGKETHPYHPNAPNHNYGIIVCAMRFFLPTFSSYYEAFWEVHNGEDPHRVFGLASVALVTAVNNLRRKGKCCCHNGGYSQCNCSSGDTVIDHDMNETNKAEYILPVVALDIAGAESGYPASDHKDAFDLAHQSFLNKTVHAGEAYGPESIFEAITDLHAERIGHGLHLFRWDMIGAGEGRGGKSPSKEKLELTQGQKHEYVENLTRYLSAMRICIEVCLSSNLQTMPDLKGNVQNHPARKMIEEGLAVTFCTDNTLVSHTTMAKELELAVTAFELSPGQLRNMVFNGFKRSFMAKRYRTKRDYNRAVISYYKWIERECGLGDVDGEKLL